jgi:hypothetical protein
MFLALSGLARSGKQRKSRSCPFSGSINAADGSVGVPCQTEMALRVDDQWLPVNTFPASTSGRFTRSLDAVTSGPTGNAIRFVVKYKGYAGGEP